MNNKPKTHDTFIIGIRNDRIIFIKTYDYSEQKEEAQKDLLFVQDKTKFDCWYISHAGQWILESKYSNGERFAINIPMP